jgi:hypothetical protein
MREFDAFQDYPKTTRKADRGIINRLYASYRDREFYDGDRQNGYGGMVDDGRWGRIAENLIRVYGLSEDSRVLQIGCHKGFLLNELLRRGINVGGTEISRYAIERAPHAVAPFIRYAPFTALPFGSAEFDLVLCVSPVYTLNLPDAVECLREITRVGKWHSFITLGAFETQEEYWILRRWMLLGTTILSKDEWRVVLEHAGYNGDYRFDTVQYLGLE